MGGTSICGACGTPVPDEYANEHAETCGETITADWTTTEQLIAYRIRAARAFCPPGYVVVSRDDLEDVIDFVVHPEWSYESRMRLRAALEEQK